ncbi:MAG: hypothetical protein ABI183_08550 [Polyangiaceae bacterium]
MTGLQLAEAIATAAKGSVRPLPTGEDREYAVIVGGSAVVLVREFRSGSIGVSVLAMQAWNIRGDEAVALTIRESAHRAKEWLSANPNGVTALDVVLEAAPKIEIATGAPCILSTPGGQPAPTEMWLGDIGIFQQESAVRVNGCRTLKTRAQLGGVIEKMVKLANAGQGWAQQIEKIRPQLEAMAKTIAETLNREAPPPNGEQWSSDREDDTEFRVQCGAWAQKRIAAKITWKKTAFGCVAGLKNRGVVITEGFDLARDIAKIVEAVRFQNSVLTSADMKIGECFWVIQDFGDDHKTRVSAGEVLKYIARVEEDHQPNAATFERESLPGRQKIDITDVWEIGSALDLYLKRV